VPDVYWKKLAVARRLLAESHCSVGKVRRTEGPSGLVWQQRPSAGAVLAKGGKVTLFVGRSR
jgi:beta-lactam-binding protein with PASTA domain